jgi:hypothetical protein
MFKSRLLSEISLCYQAKRLTSSKSAMDAFIMPNSSDIYISLARSILESVETAASPGSFYVDMFPSRAYHIVSSTLTANIYKLRSDVHSRVDRA